MHGGLRRGMTQNRTADSGGIQAALRELFPVIAVLDELIREPKIDHIRGESLCENKFAHSASGASGDCIFLDGNEEFMTVHEFSD